MKEATRLVLCTCPDVATAEHLAHLLVENRLAACVNVIPAATSVYRWEGKVERETEALMIAKTSVRAYPRLQERLLREHPYEVPEILALDVADGLPAYLEWVDSCVTAS